MQATFKINETEFNGLLLKKLKALFRNRTFVIGIEDSVNDENNKYLTELTEAMEDVEAGRNLVSFTGNEYLSMIEKLGNK